MVRTFNTAGPCDPRKHYMLPPERRLPRVRELIDQEQYFVLHAPRQSGKTTCVRTLAATLTAEGRYAAVHASCEAAQAAGSDVDAGVTAVLRSLEEQARRQLPQEICPPSMSTVADIEALSRLQIYLSRWAESSPRPVVLFLDEIDALLGTTLISVLRQLRSGYPDRPEHFAHSIVLVGLRDVRDYRLELRPDADSLGTSSPFNIKVESLLLRDFTAEEVVELYRQHAEATQQDFSAKAMERAFELTQGQPWLVNALAAQAVRGDTRTELDLDAIERAKESIILRRDTHLDSLLDRLREPRVRRVIEPILTGELLAPDVFDDDLGLVQDLGLVTRQAPLEIANPIYREVIPRALAQGTEVQLNVTRTNYLKPDGALDLDRLLLDFQAFWCEHAEAYLHRQPYSEAAAQLIFMAYLQRVVNGGSEHGPGVIEREYAVGSGRIDLHVRWPLADSVQRWAVELKVWRQGRPDPEAKGLEQLGQYLQRLGLTTGTLIIFDGRLEAPPLSERCQLRRVQLDGCEVEVLRL